MPYIGQKRSVRSQEAIEKGLVTKSQLKAWQKRAVDQGVGIIRGNTIIAPTTTI